MNLKKSFLRPGSQELYIYKQPMSLTVLTQKHSLLHRDTVCLIFPPRFSRSVIALGISLENSTIFTCLYTSFFLAYRTVQDYTSKTSTGVVYV